MSAQEPLDVKRLRLLTGIYDLANADVMAFLTQEQWRPIATSLGLTEDQANAAVMYLERKRLILFRATQWLISITEYGIDEVEAARRQPERGTREFPAAVTLNIIGEMHGSQAQIGSHGSTQVGTFRAFDIDAVRAFAGQLETRLHELELREDDRDELQSDLASLQAQVTSPRPKEAVIRPLLGSMRTVLLGAAGSAAGGALLGAINQLM